MRKNILPFVLLFILLSFTALGYFLLRETTDIFKRSEARFDGKESFPFRVATNFRDWNYWYPVYFGQKEGERVINWWNSVGGKDILITGMAYVNIPDNLPTLPRFYQGERLDFFFIYQCSEPYGNQRDPKCLNLSKYLEIVSLKTQGPNYDLTTWARGTPRSWEVYFDPERLGGYDNCRRSRMLRANVDLTKEGLKKPLVFRLPKRKGQMSVSEPVCALVFSSYYQHPSRIIDSRDINPASLGVNPNLAFETGNWIVLTFIKDIFRDSKNREIIYAENMYMTDNEKAAARFTEQYCRKNPNDKFHCFEKENEIAEKDSSERIGLEYLHKGRKFRLFAFEEYWMRKVERKEARGKVIAKYGFGAFKWYSRPDVIDWDKVYDLNSRVRQADTAENQVYIRERCRIEDFSKGLRILDCN